MIGKLVDKKGVLAVLDDSGIWSADNETVLKILRELYDPTRPRRRGLCELPFGYDAIRQAARDFGCKAEYAKRLPPHRPGEDEGPRPKRKHLITFADLEDAYKSLGGHDYGCLLAPLPKSLAKGITDWALENVPDFYLSPGGRESRPHITIKFGFTESSPETVSALKALLVRHGPISVQLGRFAIFPAGDDGAPLYIEAESDQLHQLNKAVSESFDCVDTHPTYVPHVCTAYLDPDVAEKYASLPCPFAGLVIRLEDAEYSSPDDEVTQIPLVFGGLETASLFGAKDWTSAAESAPAPQSEPPKPKKPPPPPEQPASRPAPQPPQVAPRQSAPSPQPSEPIPMTKPAAPPPKPAEASKAPAASPRPQTAATKPNKPAPIPKPVQPSQLKQPQPVEQQRARQEPAKPQQDQPQPKPAVQQSVGEVAPAPNSRHDDVVRGELREMGVPHAEAGNVDLAKLSGKTGIGEPELQAVIDRVVQGARVSQPGEQPAEDVATRKEPVQAQSPPAAPLNEPSGPPAPTLTKKDVPGPPIQGKTLLAKGPITAAEPIDPTGRNKNFTQKVTLADGAQGVFKVAAGEWGMPDNPTDHGGPPRAGIVPGTYWRREVASRRVAEVLGLGDLVPETDSHETEDQVGSMQQFIEGAKKPYQYPKEYWHDGPDDAARAAVFDYLLSNSDRHLGNWMLNKSESGPKLVLIDNGFCLPYNYDDYNDETELQIQHGFWTKAADDGMFVPDLKDWKNKWPEVEQVLESAGIEPEAIYLARRRFADLIKHSNRLFASLPMYGFASGRFKTVGDYVTAKKAAYEDYLRRVRYAEELRRKQAGQ